MSLFKPNDIFAGRYELNELCGRGEFSEVWKARDQMADGAVVSLKIFDADPEPAEDKVRHFRRQFSVSQSISHPHLLKVFHYDVSEGLPYLVMPFCPLGSLATLIQKKGSFSERQLALIMCQAASALRALHQHEPPLLHGNLKPDNILATDMDFFLLADLGSGNEAGESSADPSAAAFPPSAAYASPESFGQFRHTDSSADIFSLGVSLYETATGTLPWGGKGGQMLLKGEKVPNLPEHFSAEINELLQASMSANKNQRPKAKDLHLRAKHYLETGSWNMPEKDGPDQKHSNKRTPYLLAAATILLLAMGAYFIIQNQNLSFSTAGIKNGEEPAERDREVEEMLIATLEDQLEEMRNRTLELEEENQQLKQTGGTAIVKESPSAAAVEEKLKPEPPKETTRETKTPEPVNVLSQPVVTPKKDIKQPSAGEIEEQLNKISNPAISEKAREAWKKELLAQFSDGAVRILDESDGTAKRFSTRIFINLLYRVPHTVVVKEVKTDRNQKISELRLEMQPKG